jgi:hypothetical protein
VLSISGCWLNLFAPHKDKAVGAAAEQRAASQLNTNHGPTMAGKRLHARVFAVWVPRRKDVDAAVSAAAAAHHQHCSMRQSGGVSPENQVVLRLVGEGAHRPAVALEFGVRQHAGVDALPEVNLPQVKRPSVRPANDGPVLSDPRLDVNAARQVCAVGCSFDGLRFGNGIAHHALQLDGHCRENAVLMKVSE